MIYSKDSGTTLRKLKSHSHCKIITLKLVTKAQKIIIIHSWFRSCFLLKRKLFIYFKIFAHKWMLLSFEMIEFFSTKKLFHFHDSIQWNFYQLSTYISMNYYHPKQSYFSTLNRMTNFRWNIAHHFHISWFLSMPL